MTNSTNKMTEINQGVRQGCSLSPTLFKIYIDEVTTKWLQTTENKLKLITPIKRQYSLWMTSHFSLEMKMNYKKPSLN